MWSVFLTSLLLSSHKSTPARTLHFRLDSQHTINAGRMADQGLTRTDFECLTKAEFEASVAHAVRLADAADLLQKTCKANFNALPSKLTKLQDKLHRTHQIITDRLSGRDLLLGQPLEDDQLKLLASNIWDMRGRCETLHSYARSKLDFDNIQHNLEQLTKGVRDPNPVYTDWKFAQDRHLTGRYKELARYIDSAHAKLGELSSRLARDVVTVSRTEQEVQQFFTEQVSTVVAHC
jgi:hypothetical protein